MLDSFFAKGFKASKCKTMLKLTIPRIKLLRNRKELQIKQMRKDIAKLLETGQEATARIRVEHIIRDENMMAAQEILELFCELIAVRLPIIESQRECPLDLKEAITSICFAAPRCADLPELLQVQMSFASKYGKEFVQAAAELMPNCGVNRQLIELLSVRAPPPEKKLKLLKEIAEEHEIDWDPSPSETELFKSHEDLLNGPTNFVSGSKVPLHEEKHDEILQSASIPGADGHDDSEENTDELEFPEVPKVPLRPGPDSFAAPPQPSAPHHDPYHASQTHVESDQNQFHHSTIDPDEILRVTESESHGSSANPKEGKQFVPFISPPSFLPASLPVGESKQSLSPSETKTDEYRDLNDVVAAARVAAESAEQAAVRTSNQSPSIKTDGYGDLNDVLAAARAAAESAERAAAAARSAASLAEVRIAELSKTKSGQSLGSDTENPFASNNNVAAATEKLHLDDRNASGDYGDNPNSWNSSDPFENDQTPNGSKHSTYDEPKMESNANKQELPSHQPRRISSMDSDTDFSYPNLFHSQSGKSNF